MRIPRKSSRIEPQNRNAAFRRQGVQPSKATFCRLKAAFRQRFMGRVSVLAMVLMVYILGVVRGFAGTETEAAFEAANKLYAQNKFSDAATAYQKLIETGSVSPALHFNLGNAHFKSGRIGRAVAAYQRAAAMTPRDPDTRANLQFARNQVQGPTVRPGFVVRTLGRLSLNEWAVLCAAGVWLTFTLLALRQFKPNLAPGLRTPTWAAALATLVLVATTTAAFSLNPSRHQLIVTANETTVRSSPFDESPAVFTVNDGAELRVLDRKDGWVQVTAGAQRFGWLKRESVVFP